MPNLAGVIKSEIRRLARREIRAELAQMKKASAQYRRDIAALKRQIHDQGRQLSALARTSRREAAAARHNGDARSTRFSAKWLKAHREKLGLSAADYAALVGVSGQTIYNWETGQTRPQPQQLQALGSVRRLGKREAWKQLEAAS